MHLFFLHIQKTFILHLRQIQSYSMRGLCTENHDLSVVEKQLMEVCLEQTIKKQNRIILGCGNKTECDMS